MRSRMTNYLQVIVLLSGFIYIVVGTLFFLTPISIAHIFNLDISEEWLNVIPNNELFFIVFTVSRGFAALQISTGLAMILPLFDPLRYRQLIYYTGVLFPALISALFTSALITNYNKVILFLLIIYIAIGSLTASGLYVTVKNAKNGVE
jgi:hypothetical protein